MAGTLYFHCRGPRFNPRSHKLRPVAWDQKTKAQKWERACCKWRTTGVFVLQLHLLSSSCYGKCEVGSGAVRGRLGSSGREPCLSL